MPIHENVIISIWHAIGSPSYISGALVGGLWRLWKYTTSKIKELERLNEDIKCLRNEMKHQKELFNQRINDLNK